MSDDQKRFSHVDQAGTARMVDVSDKPATVRDAEAWASISMRPETLTLIQENRAKKGDVLGVARIAGIMAAKRTSEWIPLCHNLPLTRVEVEFGLNEQDSRVDIRAAASTEGKTGVEMEALTAVAAAALTVYDMCKAADRGMVINDIHLTHKTGGKTGTYQAG